MNEAEILFNKPDCKYERDSNVCIVRCSRGCKYKYKWFYLVMGPGQKILTRVGWGQPSMLWVWRISPKNVKIFNFFLRIKKISSGRVKKYPGQGPSLVLSFVQVFFKVE